MLRDILYLVFGLVVGAVIGFFLARNYMKKYFKRGFKKSELAHLWIEKMHLKIDSFPMVFYEGEGENDD